MPHMFGCYKQSTLSQSGYIIICNSDASTHRHSTLRPVRNSCTRRVKLEPTTHV